jgi:4,5-DOPA dioxygenase extradiol
MSYEQKSSGNMPVLFIGHGSPMNVVMDNDFTRSLRSRGAMLPRPNSILVISAHWLAKASLVTCMKNPEQIYDFFGFPPELYQVRYPCAGEPVAAQRVARLTGYMVNCSAEWGLDHASWAVLKHLYPEADVPVIEMSLNYMMDPDYHYNLGKRLRALRSEGVLIIGSGNMVHNLQLMEYDMEARPYEWAVEIDETLKSLILNGEHGRLVNYEKLGNHIAMAVPAGDHYLPMLYALGLQEKDDEITFIHEGIQNGSISMRSFMIG